MAVQLTYNPFLPEVRADPYPTYQALREADPVHRSPFLPMWVLTRYEHVALVLKDASLSADRTRFEGFDPPEDFEVHQSMLTLDPPQHTRLRGLVNRAFTPRTVERLKPRIEALVERILDGAERRGSIELVSELAYPLPVTVIAEMLGVPAEDWPRFREWSRVLAASLDPLMGRQDAAIDDYVAARNALASYLSEVVAERRLEPRDDLISDLLAVGELDSRELIVMLNLLLVAGHETTVNLIGNGTLALLRHPEQMARLRDQPDLLEPAVEELLRWDSPVQLTARIATADFELGGKPICKGELLMTLLGAANRDPGQFPDPDRLDIGRSPNHHLAFGRGIHFCLGAPLARLEAQIAIGSLVRRFPALRLAGDPELSPTVTLRGLRALPLALR